MPSIHGAARLVCRIPRRVREEQAFKVQLLAALMCAYPDDFAGYEAEKPRKHKI
jgi:hypothetical protein